MDLEINLVEFVRRRCAKRFYRILFACMERKTSKLRLVSTRYYEIAECFFLFAVCLFAICIGFTVDFSIERVRADCGINGTKEPVQQLIDHLTLLMLLGKSANR